MKRAFTVLIILSLLALMPGCFSNNKMATITLFYANEDNSQILTEEREVKIESNKTLPQVAIEELLKGPAKESLKSPIPADARLISIDIEGKTAYVNFSKEFANFSGMMDEKLAVISVVNTLTDLEEVEKVQIFVEGKELVSSSGEPLGILQSYDVEQINQDLQMQTITLYFPDKQAMYVVPEQRKVKADEPLEVIVVKELMKGPETPGLTPTTIPEEAELLSVEVKNETAYVNFSKELLEKHVGGSTGEMMTIIPIVNSLTELDGITKVQFLIEGKKEKTLSGHVIFDEPFERSEDYIKK